MIIHRHSDGSEGYQYQTGDRVIVKRTINGGWFDCGPTHSEDCAVAKIDPRANWRIAELGIWYSNEWGLARCFPWMVEPHPETLTVAKIIEVPPE